MPREVFSNSRRAIFFGPLNSCNKCHQQEMQCLHYWAALLTSPFIYCHLEYRNVGLLLSSLLEWNNSFGKKTQLLKSHSQRAAWTRFNQSWLPLLDTNMQNSPSSLWSLKCHIPFCFMLLIPVDCENTLVPKLLQIFELKFKNSFLFSMFVGFDNQANIENKSYGHGYPTWGEGRCTAKHREENQRFLKTLPLEVTCSILETDVICRRAALHVDMYRHCGFAVAPEGSQRPRALLQCQESVKVDKKQSRF